MRTDTDRPAGLSFRAHPGTLRLTLGLACAVGVACSGNGAGTAPSATTPSIAISVPGGTIFIGASVQLEARETLGDGTSRPVSGATWASDNSSIATVSPVGVLTAVAAGEATISAEAGGRGTTKVRVFPEFRGTWSGQERAMACDDSGAFEGICTDPEFVAVGDVYFHSSRFTQSGASVSAVIDGGGGTTASMSGTVSVGGDLELPTAPVLPADPSVTLEIRNWKSRADVTSHMTGTYEAYFTAPGYAGSVTISVQLQNVTRTSSATVAGAEGAGHRWQQILRSAVSH